MDTRSSHADFERLLAHAGWLASLARRLVSDPALADDLVQDTWCAALRAPRDGVASERGWLAALLANLARARARGEQARKRRERSVAASKSIEGPDRLVERAEAQRLLLDLVLGLVEPNRSTLLARYVEGRSGPEIALLQVVDPSTVRTRLQRAHERLRERLRREHGDGGALGLAPLFDGPAGNLDAGAGPGAPWKFAGTQATAAWIEPGLVSTTSKIVVVVALGGCAWIAWERSDTTRPVSAPPTDAALPGAGLERTPATGHDLDAPAPETGSIGASPGIPTPTAAAPIVPAGQSMLDLELTRDGAPLSGVTVWIAPIDSWPMPECLEVHAAVPQESQTAHTDGAGMVAFQGLRAWRYGAGYDVAGRSAHPTRFVIDGLHAGYRHPTRAGSASIRGRVHDDHGRPRARASIDVRGRREAQHMVLAAITLTDEQGDFLVGDLAAGSYDVAMDPDGCSDGRGRIEQRLVVLAAGEARVVDFGSPAPAPIWSGRVLNALLEPFAGIPPPGIGGGKASSLQLVSRADGSILRAAIDPHARFLVGFRPGWWVLTA